MNGKYKYRKFVKNCARIYDSHKSKTITIFCKMDTFQIWCSCEWLSITQRLLFPYASSILATTQSLILVSTQSFSLILVSTQSFSLILVSTQSFYEPSPPIAFRVTHSKSVEGLPLLLSTFRVLIFLHTTKS